MEKNLILKAQELRALGYSYGKIGLEMGLSKSKANYLCKLDVNEIEKKKSSKEIYEEKVCKLVAKCNSINEVCKFLGHKGTNEYYKQIQKIIDKYGVNVSHFGTAEINYNRPKIELSDILKKNGKPYQTCKLRNRLLKEGLKEHKCERCGRTEWEGEAIPLQLHHINGDRTDNRLENLQLLCPNCHTLTDNYCGRKLKIDSNKCKICGKEISRKAEYCTDCYHSLVQSKVSIEHDKKHYVSKRPNSKEELIESFKKHGSFRGVGLEYNISDQGIRKWFSSYDLPTASLEMRQFVRDYYKEDIKWKFNQGNGASLTKYRMQQKSL
jgi:hypothetical protein